jgi:hypothetical protein
MGFPPETSEDSKILTDVLDPFDEGLSFLDFFEELDGFLFSEIFINDVAALAGGEVIVIAAAIRKSSFLDATARDLIQAFLGPGFNVEVMGFGVLEDVDQNLHGDSLRNNYDKVNICCVNRSHSVCFEIWG